MKAKCFNLIQSNDIHCGVHIHDHDGPTEESMNISCFVGQMWKPSICTEHKKTEDKPSDPHDDSVVQVSLVVGGNLTKSTACRNCHFEDTIHVVFFKFS